MTRTKRWLRGAATLLALLSPTAPAFAGEAEAALLQSFAGDFTGRGELVGESAETVACQLSLSPSSQQRLRYSGRCVIAGERLPLRGTIAYSDRNSRFEASATGLGTVVGQRQGNGLSFTLGREYRQRGQTGTFQVSFSLSPGSVVIDLQVADQANGAFRGRIPLSPS